MVGHIKLHRKILKWEWYKDANVSRVFIHLLLTANYKDGKWKGIEIKRGQVIVGRIELSKDVGLSEMQIRTCLNKLKTTSEITIKVTNKYSLITICKYEFYHSFEIENNQQDNQQVNRELSNKYPTNNQQITTNNNSNKNKEDKKVFINMPLAENFNGLPEIKIGAVIQLLKITKQIDATSKDISGLWEIFKIQNLTGKKFYQDEDDVYSHFINWSKSQKLEKNGTNKQSIGVTKHNAGALQLLAKGKEEYAAIARKQSGGT